MENSFPAETPHAAPPASDGAVEHQSSVEHHSAEQQPVVPVPEPEPVAADAASADLVHAGPHPSEEDHSGAARVEEGHEPHEQASGESPESFEDAEGEGQGDALSLETFEEGSLEDYAARARKGRLSSDDEAAASTALKEALQGGRADVARAVTATPFLPWVVSVQATAAAWPDMKPSFRAQFLAGLARTEGEQAARVRLSLARGLFKVDQSASLKLILLTLKLLRNKQTGLLEGKGAALFSNVLIGRGKAWALQLPLQDLKPSDADLLVFAALHGAFHAPQAPVAQLSILRWAAATERLTRLPEALEALILKGVSRWSAKWHSALRKEVAPLPESWMEMLKSTGSKQPSTPSQRPQRAESSGARGEDSDETADSDGAEDQDRDVERDVSASSDGRGGVEAVDENDGAEDDEEDEDDEEGGEERKPRSQQRPVYVSKTVPNHGNNSQPSAQGGRRGGAQQHFNLQDTLRQIDNYVAGLRGELQTAQKQLRQKDDDSRRGRRPERNVPASIPGELSAEELLRLNQQLESRNAELKARIDELTVDSEERAASCGLTADAAPPDPATQLKVLLGFKLRDDYEDFLALQQEARDLVVQQHYRTVLQHVFDVLLAEGVQLPPPGEAPAP